MVLLDNCAVHTTTAVNDTANELDITLAHLPVGTTGTMQPNDAQINKTFKDHIRRMFNQWISTEELRRARNGVAVSMR